MKTILVSGATSGIGRVAALALQAQGNQVVIIGRDKAKLAAMSGFESIQADLSLVAETRRAAREFRERFGKLDVLLNNAGAVNTGYAETSEGFERTFALNHLNYFVLTTELLDLLRASHGRVVSVASDAHKGAKVNFDDLGMKKDFGGVRQYCNTKLMNIWFANELARREPSVTSNSVHPGPIASNFGSNTTGLFRFLVKLARPFMLTEEKGARTSIWAASDPSLDKTTGQYFAKQRIAKPTAAARDPERARRLWELTEKLLASH